MRVDRGQRLPQGQQSGKALDGTRLFLVSGKDHLAQLADHPAPPALSTTRRSEERVTSMILATFRLVISDTVTAHQSYTSIKCLLHVWKPITVGTVFLARTLSASVVNDLMVSPDRKHVNRHPGSFHGL